MPPACTHAQPFPLSTLPAEWCVCLLMNLPWHIVITQSPLFTLEFNLGVVIFCGFGQRQTICVHHCSIIQNIFTALKILCALPIHPSPCHPRQQLIFLLFQQFCPLPLFNLIFSQGKLCWEKVPRLIKCARVKLFTRDSIFYHCCNRIKIFLSLLPCLQAGSLPEEGSFLQFSPVRCGGNESTYQLRVSQSWYH